MAWFIPLDAVTLWTVWLVKGLKERQWPETPGEGVSYVKRLNDDWIQYYPRLRIPHTSGLLSEVSVTRGILKEPEIGSRWIVKHYPAGDKIWIIGETPGTC